MSASRPSANLLRRQLKEMQADKDLSNISAGLVDDNIYEWEVMLMISDECKFYGGEGKHSPPPCFIPEGYQWNPLPRA